MTTELRTTAQDAGVAASLPARVVGLPMWRIILLLALPVLGQQFLILAVSLSDRFLAGHYPALPPEQQAEALSQELLALGAASSSGLAALVPLETARELAARRVAYLSAQTTAQYLAWFISSYTVLVSVGSTALVARFIGAGRKGKALRVTHQSLTLAVVLGLAASVLGLLFIEQLVRVLQLRADAVEFAVAYLTPLFVLLVFQVVETAGIACLVGAGDTVTGMIVTGCVAVVNVPLSWAFCLGLGPFPKMGFAGIALGTALSHTLGCLAVLAVLARGRVGLKLGLRGFRPSWTLMVRLLRIGVPAGIDSLSVVAGQLWFLSIINELGDVAAGAHGIALIWEALAYLSGIAFGTAAMTLVGQNLGAGKPEEAARSGWYAFAIGAAVMTVMGTIFYVFAPQMFALFCPHPSQQPVIAAGVPALRLIAFAMPALAACQIITYALRGAGDTRMPVLYTWIGFLFIRIPLAYLLTKTTVELGMLGEISGMGLGLLGAWWAMFADLNVRGAFFIYRFASGRWQRIRV
ncbi:MAG: MATE family efflux transporter [Gemmataceae bacterium]